MNGLIYSDLPEEGFFLETTLERTGIAVHPARSIEQIINNWAEQPAEFVLVAISNNTERAIQQLRQLRMVSIAPIILIADPPGEETALRFYRVGVDLVIQRPYSLLLLPYQIRPLILRSNSFPLRGLPSISRFNLMLDTRTRSITIKNQPARHLTQLEFRLLYALMTHPGQVLPAEEIVEQVWGYSGEENRELVRGLIQRLRIKVEPDPQNPQFILTEPGVGYYFNEGSGDQAIGVSGSST